MSDTNKINWKSVFFNFGEGFVVLVIGCLLEFNDDKFNLENKHIGYIVGSIGIFILISRLIMGEFFKETLKNTFEEKANEEKEFKDSVISNLKGTNKHIEQIAQLIDIREENKVDSIKKMLDIYLNITEREFSKVKEGILTEAINALTKLKNNKKSEELVSSEYYAWLLPILNNVRSGEKIKAVSCMFNTEWDDSPAEQKFIEGNINAGKRGATVDRLFIMKKSLLDEALKIPAINMHTVEEKETYKLNGFFIDRDKVEQKEGNLLRDVGHGFILFNSRVALIDKFDEGGQVRGVVTMDEYDIRFLERTFNNLKFYSKPLTQNQP